MNETLRRLRDAVTGSDRNREVEVAPDGSLHEVGAEPAVPPAQPVESPTKPTKLSERTFGSL